MPTLLLATSVLGLPLVGGYEPFHALAVAFSIICLAQCFRTQIILKATPRGCPAGHHSGAWRSAEAARPSI
jgi:hypothetical protein